LYLRYSFLARWQGYKTLPGKQSAFKFPGATGTQEHTASGKNTAFSGLPGERLSNPLPSGLQGNGPDSIPAIPACLYYFYPDITGCEKYKYFYRIKAAEVSATKRIFDEII